MDDVAAALNRLADLEREKWEAAKADREKFEARMEAYRSAPAVASHPDLVPLLCICFAGVALGIVLARGKK